MVFQDNDSGRVRASSNRPSSMSRRAVASSSRPASSLGPSDSRSSWLLSGSSRLSTSQRVHSGSEQKSSLSRATTSKGVREDQNQSSEHRSRFMEKRKGWMSHLVRERGSTSFWYSRHILIPMETYFLHALWGVVTAKFHIFLMENVILLYIMILLVVMQCCCRVNEEKDTMILDPGLVFIFKKWCSYLFVK